MWRQLFFFCKKKFGRWHLKKIPFSCRKIVRNGQTLPNGFGHLFWTISDIIIFVIGLQYFSEHLRK